MGQITMAKFNAGLTATIIIFSSLLIQANADIANRAP